ncbi:hypothetical protein GOV13_05510 [Candidatus Pacearchaeota archaeon]|nr:hypothetical protein [Candidatus Pacearchaeota archaeon]
MRLSAAAEKEYLEGRKNILVIPETGVSLEDLSEGQILQFADGRTEVVEDIDTGLMVLYTQREVDNDGKRKVLFIDHRIPEGLYPNSAGFTYDFEKIPN